MQVSRLGEGLTNKSMIHILSTLASAAAIFVWPAAVPAQGMDALNEAKARCLAMSDKAEANACAIKLATETWNVVVDIDKLDGAKNVRALIMSPELIPITAGQVNRAALALRCAENRTDLFIIWPKYLGLKHVPVKWRIDDGPIVTDEWSVSADGTITFATNPIDMSKKMIGRKELVTNVGAYGKTGTTVSFSLKGFETALKPIREACDW